VSALTRYNERRTTLASASFVCYIGRGARRPASCSC